MNCSQCGFDLAPVWRFCPSCGIRLVNAAGNTLSKPAVEDSQVPQADQVVTRVPESAGSPSGDSTVLIHPAMTAQAEGTTASRPVPVAPHEVATETVDAVTSLGRPALSASDATPVAPPIERDPGATVLARPAAASDAEVTGVAQPALDPEATSLSRPVPPDSDATLLIAAPVDDEATMVGSTPGRTAPNRQPGRPPTSATRPTRPATGSSARGRRPTSSGHGSQAGTVSGAAGATGPLEIGETFGPRYHIIRMLGIGGMGAVYQAWDAELEVALALKVIRPDVTSDPEAAAEIERRFKRELLLARQVTHPNVVRIHDLGEIDGIKYITMPYIEGKDLSDILAETGTLPVQRTLAMAKQVASGLVAAHEAGVVHRDLKPANIMIDAEDRALIMDFGIARASGGATDAGQGAASGLHAGGDAGATRVGTIVGTLDYMAPEQARGVPVDQRADVYTFGLILYRMLVGKRLAEGATTAFEDLTARMQAEPKKLREIDETIPESVESIISKCLQPDPDARFQTSAELLHALERLDENGIPLPEPPPIWKSRRFQAVAASVMAVFIGATWWLAQFVAVPIIEAPKDPVSVLIADFANETGDPTFDRTLVQSLRRALESASFITAFDRAGIQQTFRVQPPDQFDETAARQLAIKQGLGVVLAGSIAPRGDGYEITVQASEPMTGNAITSASRRASGKDEVLDTVTRLATSIRTALGDETDASAQQLAMKTISTTSLEVASHYAAAVDAQARGKAEEALASFAKAVQLDPTFGLGYQGLAVMSRNLGRLEDAQKYAGEALRYLDQMTERERMATRGYYYVRTGDYEQCVKEYSELIMRFPADVPAHNQRAFCLAQMRDIRAAVDDMRTVVQILPNHSVYRSNLAVLLNLSGDFAGAEKEIRAIQEEPTARSLAALALSQTGQGLVTEAAETYEKVKTMGPWGASFGAAGLGDLATYQGRYADAARILSEAAAAELAAKNLDNAALKFAALAYAHLAAGRRTAAAAAAEKVLENSTAPSIRFLTARILIEAGGIARAKTLAAGFASQVSAEQQAYGKIIEGGIALKNGDPRLATKLLTEANEAHETWLGRFDLGRAFLAAGAFPQADSEFDRCLQRRGEALTLIDEDPTYGYLPAVYYYLGRAREGLQTAGFADAFREYLKIRGQSSEDPFVAEVRKRVGS